MKSQKLGLAGSLRHKPLRAHATALCRGPQWALQRRDQRANDSTSELRISSNDPNLSTVPSRRDPRSTAAHDSVLRHDAAEANNQSRARQSAEGEARTERIPWRDIRCGDESRELCCCDECCAFWGGHSLSRCAQFSFQSMGLLTLGCRSLSRFWQARCRRFWDL
jgi:hypothetical protein